MEDIDGGLHPAVDGQSLDEMRWDVYKKSPQLKNADHFSEFFLRRIWNDACLSKHQIKYIINICAWF